MRMRVLLFVMILLLLSVMFFGDKLYTAKPVKFKYVSAHPSEGWYWCKTKGAKLIWYWHPVNNITNRFYVMYTLLQTDDFKSSGLSSEKIKATIVVEIPPKKSCYQKCFNWYYDTCVDLRTVCLSGKYHEKKIAQSYLKMVNPFKPVEKKAEKETQISYGYVEFYVPPSKIKYIRDYSFKIIIEWPPLSDKYYFAGSPNIPPIIVFER